MKRSGTKQFSNGDWFRLKRFYKFRCVRCSKKENIADPNSILTIDHVIPLAFGGVRNITNIQPLCRPCNEAKGAGVTDYRGRKFKN